MRPTIKDVARLAGVSIKTVSNVLNSNTNRYSTETYQRVIDAMEKLNYQPNRAAQYMRSGVIRVLALVIPDIANSYFAEIARAVIDAARDYKYTVLIEITDGQLANEQLLVSGNSLHTVDGVILDPIALTETDLHNPNIKTPIVMLGERATGEYFDHVVIDNVGAARLLTEHLLELGRRRIAILPIVTDKPNSLFYMRYQGYVEAFETAGIPLDPQFMMLVDGPLTLTYEDGMDCMERLLARGTVPDAVFALNDRVALGAMKALKQHGYRIPEDVAVAGFDDIGESYFASPSLTTISPDKQKIGQLAVSLLIDRITGVRTGPPEQFHPPYRLIIRESTAGVKKYV